ncbi:hypothetical protein [Salinispora fenicalii]|uniref:hypothetical protein n=1 Tax=Salinispora fenicalii TaxID=1137263 RepID=UPI00047F04C4|nr:hypothetical protein [Salinispora fenicalii]
MDGVVRELLGRQLEAWLPRAVARGRPSVVALAYGPGALLAATDSAAAVLGVLAEHAGQLRGRQLTVLVLADGSEELPARLGVIEATLPAEIAVHLVPGGPARLPVAVKAAGATGAPLLSYLDGAGATDPGVLAASAAGRPAELLLVTEAKPASAASPAAASSAAGAAATAAGPAGAASPTAGPAGSVRAGLAGAGFPLTTQVDLVAVDGSSARRLAFGTGHDRSLEAFKENLWAVDDDTAVRYRDPADPSGQLLDVAPDPESLGQELLAELARSGPRTVTELRRHALTATAYRSVDVQRALTGLLRRGAAVRDPEHGRLGGDVVIALARHR